ncbi:MAG: exodeoxyribonuclease V subunit gamma [Micrococcales bacterium]|nr:exodeoxyribonuclease V subunit gamma [Micrococcales bacterium]
MGQDSAAARLGVHVAERADGLVDGLADLLSGPPDDPFAPELVAVETSGVGRWVAQRLSHRLGAAGADDGIAAQIRFDPWWRVVAQVLAGVVGLDRRDDPWHPDRLVWPVLAAVDDHLDEPWLTVVRHHLGDDPADEVRRGRRLAVARHVAGLFTAYDARRPALLADWAAGRDTDGTGLAGCGAPLADDLVWQARLWRAVAERLDVPAPSQRLAEAAERLHDDPDLAHLPPRFSLFAPAALPDAHLRVLDALAAHREVHLWLVHPSAALWRRVAGRTDRQAGPVRRRDLPVLARHRLLASMAGPATELQLRVAPLAGPITVTAAPPRPPTVLGAVQQALADDRGGSTDPTGTDQSQPDRPRLSTADRSVQVHACHGRMRQVEVLRDVLTGLFADDPTLEPRDVVVLCPDVARFAPLVEAVFDPVDAADDPTPSVAHIDAPASHPGRSLRVRVADRTSTGPTNPLLAVLGRVLALASSRVTASAVLDLARTDPVRRRFGFDDDALARLREWTAESGVRWGEDAARRARYHLHHPQGTWAAGLDRLLLGVAMAEEDQRFLGAVLPVDDVSSSDVDLVGRWTELLDRLTGLLAQLSGTHPVAHWLDTCELALTLLTDTTTTDRWQQVEAAQALAQVRGRVADDAVPLRLADVVALLGPALAGRNRRSGYRTGALTVCGFAPLRAVPHRVVVLLGMDDGAFPRRGAPDGDDVTARDQLVGEPDPRADDRRLFCDAVAAATQTLVVVYCGADERTGARRVPCVPVAELLDAVDDAVTLHHPDGRPATARDLVVRHPLHPVDPRAFGGDPADQAGASAGPTSYDRTALAAARALVAARAEPPQPRPFLAPPLVWPPDEPTGAARDIELASLVAALQHPVGAFVRDRLGVTLRDATELADDRLPLEVDGLTRWAAGDRILRAALAGADLAVASAAERRRGHLPPAALGQQVASEVYAEAAAVQRAAAGYLTEPPRNVAVTVDLPGGRRLTGAVEVRGHLVAAATYAGLSAKRRLQAWLELLAVVADGSVPVRGAVVVGRRRATTRLRAPERDAARACLASAVELYDEAMTEPLPLPLTTSWAYARPRLRGRGRDLALQLAETQLQREFDNRYDDLVWGGRLDRETLLAAPPTPADTRRAPDEDTRFGALAVAWWRDLDAHEELGG